MKLLYTLKEWDQWKDAEIIKPENLHEELVKLEKTWNIFKHPEIIEKEPYWERRLHLMVRDDPGPKAEDDFIYVFAIVYRHEGKLYLWDSAYGTWNTERMGDYCVKKMEEIGA